MPKKETAPAAIGTVSANIYSEVVIMIADDKGNVNLLSCSDFLKQIWRGGNYGLVWQAQTRTSVWLDLSTLDYAEFDQETFDAMAWRQGDRKLPKSHWVGDVYVGINPSASVPPCNKRGNTDQKYIAAQTDYLQCTNTLFAEFDGKDNVTEAEYTAYLPADYGTLSDDRKLDAKKVAKEIAFYFDPDVYKLRTLDAIKQRSEELDLIPTVIIDSGGGYHCYWHLIDTVYIDDNNRDDIAATQHDFVAMMAGDTGAADIRRVLRIPGWQNCKPGWGKNKPTVHVIHYDPAMVYDYAHIETLVGDWAFDNSPRRQAASCSSGGSGSFNGQGMGKVRAEFNKRYKIVDLMIKKNYMVCSDDGKGFIRLSRPGKDGTPSISILPATEEMPEIAVSHSSNDELHHEKTKRISDDGKVRRGLDAWLVYVHLYHDGNWKKAYILTKKAFGMWDYGQNIEGVEVAA